MTDEHGGGTDTNGMTTFVYKNPRTGQVVNVPNPALADHPDFVLTRVYGSPAPVGPEPYRTTAYVGEPLDEVETGY